jgi:hypothetical protein
MSEKKKHLLVTLDDEYLDKAADVIRRLKKAGLTRVKYLDSVGIASGQALPSKIGALKKISGVRSVEESVPIQLPPPDAPIQ